MLNITYYTDPLCCWSWAFEPQWKRLLFEYEGSIEWNYKMGGLIPAWDSFHDTTNNVSRPIQMGPVWMHAAQISGMPMNTRIWMEDPPASSYPACIAVCCAGLQSGAAAAGYLRLLREAIMIDGINIAKPDNLQRLASRFAAKNPTGFELKKFAADFENGNGLEAFKADMNLVRLHNINRFPTLIVRTNGKAIIITGYRTYNDLVAAIRGLSPQLEKTRSNYSSEQYLSMWPSPLERELQEIRPQELATPG